MGLLYKEKEDQTTTMETSLSKGKLRIEFFKDCGKFGTEETLDRYTLTAERLLEILQSQDLEYYTEKEIQ